MTSGALYPHDAGIAPKGGEGSLFGETQRRYEYVEFLKAIS